MSANKTELKQFFDDGFDCMSKSTVAICGIARDCSDQVRHIIPKLEALGERFKAYKIIVVENDSRDDTQEVISSWADENHNVVPIFFSEAGLAPDAQSSRSSESGCFNYSRISRIAFARNIYLQELPRLDESDFVVVVDLDVLDFSLAGIANSFARQDDWDCATSAGFRYTLRRPFNRDVYWDTYAFEPMDGYAGGVQHLSDIRSSQTKIRKELQGDCCVSAQSAFGGLAIYKRCMLEGQQYKTESNDDSDVPFLCEHVMLHRSINQSNSGFRLVINPAQKVYYESLATTLKRSLRDNLKF